MRGEWTGRRSVRGLPAVAVAAVTVAATLAAPAYAADSVTVTSPADGEVVTLAGSSADPAIADGPLAVTFLASVAPASCSLDGQPAAPCSSPVLYEHLVAGDHTVVVSAGDASDSVTFTVATVVLGPPPVERRVTGRLKARWRVDGTRTRVRRLVLSDLQRRVRVSVTCRGRGCPSRHPYARKVSRRVDLTASLSRRTLRPGTRVIVRVSKAGFRTKRFEYVVRRGLRPTRTVT